MDNEVFKNICYFLSYNDTVSFLSVNRELRNVCDVNEYFWREKLHKRYNMSYFAFDEIKSMNTTLPKIKYKATEHLIDNLPRNLCQLRKLYDKIPDFLTTYVIPFGTKKIHRQKRLPLDFTIIFHEHIDQPIFDSIHGICSNKKLDGLKSLLNNFYVSKKEILSFLGHCGERWMMTNELKYDIISYIILFYDLSKPDLGKAILNVCVKGTIDDAHFFIFNSYIDDTTSQQIRDYILMVEQSNHLHVTETMREFLRWM